MPCRPNSAGGAPKDEQASTLRRRARPRRQGQGRRPEGQGGSAKGQSRRAKDKAAAPKDKAAAAKAKAAASKDKSAAAKANATGTIRRPKPPEAPLAVAATASTPSRRSRRRQGGDRAGAQGEPSRARELQSTIGDPVARKLVEWAILRSDDNEVDFARYVAFITENPSWPSIGLLRRRAEAALWQDRLDPATVRALFRQGPARSPPRASSRSRARCCCKATAPAPQSLVREAWRNENFSGELEGQVLDVFRDLITSADHKARMDMRLYAEDADGAMRSANRAGGHAPAIAKARIAVIKKAANAKALLDAVPAEARRDIGYIFSRVQLLRRDDKAAEAAELILSVPHDPAQAIDTDQWWIERRLVARKLLDLGDAKTAYRVAQRRRRAQPGELSRPSTSSPPAGSRCASSTIRRPRSPISPRSARAPATRSRSRAPATGRAAPPRRSAATARRARITRRRRAIPTAYYGQIARARLGLKDIVVRPPPEPASDRRAPGPARSRARDRDPLRHRRARSRRRRAGRPRRALDRRGRARGDRRGRRPPPRRPRHAAARQGRARTRAAARALRLPDRSACPNIAPIGPQIEPAVVYAIARQESTFNQKTVSSAKAMGLMQVTPAAGRYVAKKFNAPYDEKRLLSDQVYNVQLGAAELGDLIEDYRGSYILIVRRLQCRPRPGQGMDRAVRRSARPQGRSDRLGRAIPFSETRNYVQRVLENLQVYRVRFGGGSKLLIEADLRRGGAQN